MLWGPNLSERQRGTVREDDSDGGDAWNYFSHDQARSQRRPVVRVVDIAAVALCIAAVFVTGCTEQPVPKGVSLAGGPPAATASVTRIEAGPDALKRVQAALINAKPRDVIELGAATSVRRSRSI
jgi:hypothetical protein